ncbi:hypothetical protein PYS58_01740 [Chryseobacterium indologenes]|uniref:hypothetical protein n=1 Tax=Chryseobacterium indologenes TaxID=253 RepID=UPI0023E85618|nr:hypothetical protein [Chryseobacterium indologenes]WET49855.1 hypothetical protein PYS58_01740 [Chryseobacterium indologenes]
MKKIPHLLLLFPLFCLSCSKQNNSVKHDVNSTKVFPKNKSVDISETKPDIILVKIAENIFFKWNIKENSIVKDSNYYQYLENNNTIQLIANNINSTTDLNVQICSKKTGHLKVGDIAFLYLWENRKFYLFKCLKLQFDAIGKNCKLPEDLLDYLEKNRQTVQKKIIECI